MHHRVRLRALPVEEDRNDLSIMDVEDFGTDATQTKPSQSTTTTTTIGTVEITHGNQEEDNHLLVEKGKGKEAARAVLLLNVVAILWGTQVRSKGTTN